MNLGAICQNSFLPCCGKPVNCSCAFRHYDKACCQPSYMVFDKHGSGHNYDLLLYCLSTCLFLNAIGFVDCYIYCCMLHLLLFISCCCSSFVHQFNSFSPCGSHAGTRRTKPWSSVWRSLKPWCDSRPWPSRLYHPQAPRRQVVLNRFWNNCLEKLICLPIKQPKQVTLRTRGTTSPCQLHCQLQHQSQQKPHPMLKNRALKVMMIKDLKKTISQPLMVNALLDWKNIFALYLTKDHLIVY